MEAKKKRGPKPDAVLGNRVRIPNIMVSSKTFTRLAALQSGRDMPLGRSIDQAVDLLWKDAEVAVPGVK